MTEITIDMYYMGPLPNWAKRRQLRRRKNFLSQLRLTLLAVRHFPKLLRQMDELDLQTP